MKKSVKIVLLTSLSIVLIGLSVWGIYTLANKGSDDQPTQYTLTIENGTGDGTFNEGTQVVATATIPNDKEFVSWNEGNNVISIQNPYKFKLTKSITITAIFKDKTLEPTQYTLTVENGTGSGSFDEGTLVTATATIPSGKEFVSWNEGNSVVGTENPYTFELNKSFTLTAIFKDVVVPDPTQYTLTVVNGTGSGTFNEGAQVTAMATTPNGQEFVSWNEGASVISILNPYTFPLTKNITLTAIFKDQIIKLPTPANLVISNETLTWDEVENKSGYIVNIDDTEHETAVASYSLAALTDVKIYQIKIMAKGDGTVYSNSDYSDIVEFEYAIELSFGLINNNTEYEVTGLGNIMETDIIIPATYKSLPVTRIRDFAFQDCASLTSVTIPDGVTDVAEGAFYNCTGLTEVIMPNSVITIGSAAFLNCTSLAQITMPNNVTSIGNISFGGTQWLENQPDGVLYICKVLYAYKGTMSAGTSITILDGTVMICGGAFAAYSELAEVIIPNSVISIGDAAFYECVSLTEIVIPDSVINIGRDAFFGCSGLLEITVLSAVPPTLGVDTLNLYNNKIYVPANSLEAYKNADSWKDYASQIFAI